MPLRPVSVPVASLPAAFVILSAVLLIAAPLAANSLPVRFGGRLGLGPTWYGGPDFRDAIDDAEGEEFTGEVDGTEATVTIESIDPRAGFGVGFDLFAEVELLEWLSVQPEIGYQRHNARLEVEGSGELDNDVPFDEVDFDETSILTADLLETSLYARPSLEAGPGRVYGLLGPRLSIVIGDLSVTAEDDDDLDETTEPDNRLLYGAGAGAGYMLYAGDFDLFAEAVFTTTFNSPAESATVPLEDEEIELEGPALQGVSIGLGAVRAY